MILMMGIAGEKIDCYLLKLNKPQYGLRDGRRLQFFSDSRVMSLVKLPEKDGDLNDEGESPFEKQDDGSHLSQDISPCFIENLWIDKDFRIILHRAVRSFRSGSQFLDSLKTFRPPRYFIDQTGKFFDIHMLRISCLILDVRTCGYIESIPQDFKRLVSEFETLFEATEGQTLMFLVKAVGSCQ